MNTEQLKTGKFRTWLKKNYGIQDFENYKNTQAEELAIQFASQESKKAIYEVLIDKDFIIYCLNQAWNYAHEQLQKKDLGDIEREIYQQQKNKAKALMTKLDS